MERLSLDKFQDVKLEDKQLSFIHGETCTGGGGWYNQDTGATFSYESDCVGDNGSTMYFKTKLVLSHAN